MSSKLTVAEKIEVQQFLNGAMSERQVAEKYKTSKSTISRIKIARATLEELEKQSVILSIGCKMILFYPFV